MTSAAWARLAGSPCGSSTVAVTSIEKRVRPAPEACSAADWRAEASARDSPALLSPLRRLARPTAVRTSASAIRAALAGSCGR